jgi:ABC-type nickel/cobalt efflux system permease component RcnA
MTSILLLGLLIGMRHALEADHVAAVATLATRSRGAGETLRVGMAWGAGHSVTLLGVGTVVLLFDSLVPERVTQALEMAVGIMLVVLGLDVLRRLLRERVHFHSHRHGGELHTHAHSHAGQKVHDAAAHDHVHPNGLTSRALLVGMMHGLAGSAALILLTLGTLDSPGLGILYILMFGAGSIIGMAALSCVIALPLRLFSRSLSSLYRGLTATIGAGTAILGTVILYDSVLAFGF